MKPACPVCYEHQSANEYYRMTVHKNEYHKLIGKIYEKIEFYEFMVNRDDDISYSPNHIRKTLKSLLDNKK